MTTEVMQENNMEKQIEKQMGCMAGFLHHILTGRSTKRLPPPTVVDASPENFVGSPLITPELEKPQQTRPMASPSPGRSKSSPKPELRSPMPYETPPKSPLILPILELKEGTRSSWKFCKESPRLSLDSRATFDSKGSPSLQPKDITSDGDDTQRRSTSVVARLMGLESLPNSSPEQVKKPQLRRSASDSRISRDVFQFDNHCIMMKQPKRSQSFGNNTLTRDNAITDKKNALSICKSSEPLGYVSKNIKSQSSNRGLHRKTFFDSADFFPEPRQTVSIYGEIEKRLKLRGIDEQSKDLYTLKQILEAMQLKGLLRHSNKSSESKQISQRNFVYDESPIVVMKPSNFRAKTGARRNLTFSGENVTSPRREIPANDRNVRSPARSRSPIKPTRSEINAKSSKSLVKPKPSSVETKRKANESTEPRRVSPVRSPKLSSKGIGSDQSITSRSPSTKRSTAEICRKEKIIVFVTEDESSSISETTVSSSSQTDTERSKVEEFKNGRSLLERCDKLLHSIAEISAVDSQPSPVSVLDSSFYKDDSCSPSPVMKRSIDFKEQSVELEEEIRSPAFSPIQWKPEDNSQDSDFLYISDILRASNSMLEDSDVFVLLEKQQYLQGKDASKVARLQRKLTFDTITEILDRSHQLPPWKIFSCTDSSIAKPLLQKIWSEFQRIRGRDSTEDLLEFICGILKRDLAPDSINGWGDCPEEMSDAVLDIERLIFKDMVVETIRDLAAFADKSTILAPHRKLVF